jgi:hypothetical protein
MGRGMRPGDVLAVFVRAMPFFLRAAARWGAPIAGVLGGPQDIFGGCGPSCGPSPRSIIKILRVLGWKWPSGLWPSPIPDMVVPVHQELITKNGTFNLENMVFDSLIQDGMYEFLFILTPIRFKGGTGSPARPLAIR